MVIVTYNPGISACLVPSTGTCTNIQGLDLVNGHCDWFMIWEGVVFFYRKVTLYCITLKYSFTIYTQRPTLVELTILLHNATVLTVSARSFPVTSTCEYNCFHIQEGDYMVNT